MYNQFGHAGVDPNFQGDNGGHPFGAGSPFGGAGGFHFEGGQMHAENIEEVFDMFFGGGGGGNRRQRGPRRGADLQMEVVLSFQEAVFGCKKDLDLSYQIMDQKTGNVEMKHRKVTVDTPPGIDSGMNLRLKGKGAEGDPGAPPGNLLVQVLVAKDDYFVRDSYDLHTEIPISFSQAILGGTVDVKTLKGEVEMKIPKGCQPDTKLMLRGKGIQRLHQPGFGNQVVHLKIEIPKEVTPRQEELLREFDKESEEHNLGVSGRIAQAAESAFEKMFGKGKKGEKNDGKEKTTNKAKDEDSSDDQDDKKQAAQ